MNAFGSPRRPFPAGSRRVELATEVGPELIPAEPEEARPQPTPLDFLVDEEERPRV